MREQQSKLGHDTSKHNLCRLLTFLSPMTEIEDMQQYADRERDIPSKIRVGKECIVVGTFEHSTRLRQVLVRTSSYREGAA